MSDIAYKPLEKINKQIYEGGTFSPPKFMPSYYEWLREQGADINIYKTHSAASEVTLWTIPVGYIFFLTNVCLSCGVKDDTGGEKARLSIQSAANEIIIVEIFPVEGMGALVPQWTTITQNFVFPFKIYENQSLRLDNPTNGQSSVCVQGFLVPKTSIPSL